MQKFCPVCMFTVVVLTRCPPLMEITLGNLEAFLQASRSSLMKHMQVYFALPHSSTSYGWKKTAYWTVAFIYFLSYIASQSSNMYIHNTYISLFIHDLTISCSHKMSKNWFFYKDYLRHCCEADTKSILNIALMWYQKISIILI